RAKKGSCSETSGLRGSSQRSKLRLGFRAYRTTRERETQTKNRKRALETFMAITKDDPRRFLHPDTIAKISRLDLRARQVVEGFISGMHKSPVFGHSIEFVQHREYTTGDDLRHLDWKVWSKTDRYYVKQYEAETNLRCNLVLDVSESMHYGRGALNKYNYACTVAACLGYLLLRQQDSVGLITFDDDVRQVVPARSQQLHIDALVKAMDVSR